MFRFIKWVILKKEDYQKLITSQSELYELQSKLRAAQDKEIVEELDNRYCKYIGKWFEDEAGIVFQIRSIGLNSTKSPVCNVYLPNDTCDAGYDDVELYDITTCVDEKDYSLYKELTKQQVIEKLLPEFED